jgi:hypothetical protein
MGWHQRSSPFQARPLIALVVRVARFAVVRKKHLLLITALFVIGLCVLNGSRLLSTQLGYQKDSSALPLEEEPSGKVVVAIGQ